MQQPAQPVSPCNPRQCRPQQTRQDRLAGAQCADPNPCLLAKSGCAGPKPFAVTPQPGPVRPRPNPCLPAPSRCAGPNPSLPPVRPQPAAPIQACTLPGAHYTARPTLASPSRQSATAPSAAALHNKDGSFAAQTSPPDHTAKPPSTHTRALCSRQVEHTPAFTRASSSLPVELPPQAPPVPQSGRPGLGLHATPALPTTRQQPPQHTPGPHRAPTPSSRGIAVLSFFCGIGTTFLALRDLGIQPILMWSWETDPDCRRVTSAHSPSTCHWGDALSSEPSQVASLLHEQCPADTLVLVCSSPPCTDFSQVRASPPGLQGQEGCKFRQWCQWLSSFRKSLKLQHVFLVENVLPSGEVHRELDKLVGHNSFVVDAASWGVVSRPRLWWSNVLTPPTLDSSQPPVVLAGLARWRR